MITAIRTLALGLGLLGSAALSGMGPLSAHAGNPPKIQAAVGNCGVFITGNRFTPGGTVDLYVSMSGNYIRSFAVTLTATHGVLDSGNISQQVATDFQTTQRVRARAYDTASKQWSNTTTSIVFCLG